MMYYILKKQDNVIQNIILGRYNQNLNKVQLPWDSIPDIDHMQTFYMYDIHRLQKAMKKYKAGKFQLPIQESNEPGKLLKRDLKRTSVSRSELRSSGMLNESNLSSIISSHRISAESQYMNCDLNKLRNDELITIAKKLKHFNE